MPVYTGVIYNSLTAPDLRSCSFVIQLVYGFDTVIFRGDFCKNLIATAL